jgi:uncharacterized protein (DUF2237 family)
MGRWVSPNDMQKAAEEQMLDGRKPVTREEWALCVNFWAANVEKGLEQGTVMLMGHLFNECPLDSDELEDIAKFQAVRK